MYYLYQIGIRVYYLIIRLIAPFNERASAWFNDRKEHFPDFQKLTPPPKDVIWFHASSLGEYEMAAPLISEWKEKRPESFILLTFFSPSGYRIQKDSKLVDQVLYIPREIRSEIEPFLDFYRPGLVVMVKYEVWPVLLRQLGNRGIPVYLTSALFERTQLFFRWYGKWYLSNLKLFAGIFVQDSSSGILLEKNGVKGVEVSGDTRIDRVIELANRRVEMNEIQQFCNNSTVIIGGSTWHREEDFLNRFMNLKSGEKVKLILAPHDVGEAHLEGIEKEFDDKIIRYSDLKKESGPVSKSVLLIDSIGHLSRLYHFADIAIIGGAFGSGLHNILEPSVHGVPSIFGPSYKKFREAVDLVESGGAFSVKSYEEFEFQLSQLLSDENTLSRAGKGCRAYVEKHQGATTFIISHLLEKHQHFTVNKIV